MRPLRAKPGEGLDAEDLNAFAGEVQGHAGRPADAEERVAWLGRVSGHSLAGNSITVVGNGNLP